VFRKARRIVATDLDPELGTPLDELETEVVDPAWIMVYQKKFDLGTQITEVINHCLWLINDCFNIKYAAMDQTQVGEHPFEVIHSQVPIMQGVYFSAQAKQDVFMSYYLMVEQRRVGFPYSTEYEENFTQHAEQQAGYSQAKPSAVREPEEKGVMMYWHPAGRHDDRLVSCCLAIWSTIHRVLKSGVGVAR